VLVTNPTLVAEADELLAPEPAAPIAPVATPAPSSSRDRRRARRSSRPHGRAR
jgi:hypothetical protein